MKKEFAVGFLKMVVARKIKEAFERYVSPEFIHHNQYFKSDRQSLMDAMVKSHSQFPNTQLDIKYVYEERNTVITHSHIKHKAADMGVAVIHIMRFEGPKIVEMWDLGQEIEANSPNEKGPF